MNNQKELKCKTKLFKIRKILYSILALSIISLVLGSFSVRPFTKLLIPWILFDQWRKVNYPAEFDPACVEELRNSGALFVEGKVPESDLRQGCSIDSIVVVSKLRFKLTNIAYPPQADLVSLSCDFATKLNVFITEHLIPISQKYFASPVKEILHKGGYACRGQRDFTSIKSEHAFAQALDFSGMKFEDGSVVLVENDYGKSSAEGKFLEEISDEACRFFGTNLGPKFNYLHKDHFHWSIGFPRLCK